MDEGGSRWSYTRQITSAQASTRPLRDCRVKMSDAAEEWCCTQAAADDDEMDDTFQPALPREGAGRSEKKWERRDET